MENGEIEKEMVDDEGKRDRLVQKTQQGIHLTDRTLIDKVLHFHISQGNQKLTITVQ